MLTKLWLFTFTQQERQLCSARIAAPDRSQAVSIMARILGRPLNEAPYTHPEDGTILEGCGQIEVVEPGLVSIRDLNNRLIIPA